MLTQAKKATEGEMNVTGDALKNIVEMNLDSIKCNNH